MMVTIQSSSRQWIPNPVIAIMAVLDERCLVILKNELCMIDADIGHQGWMVDIIYMRDHTVIAEIGWRGHPTEVFGTPKSNVKPKSFIIEMASNGLNT